MEDKRIGVRFRMLNNAIRRYVDHNSEFNSKLDNITCSNGWIIGHLCYMETLGKDVYQRDLETDFGITRSTASKVLTLLEKKEMIKRMPVSHDKRMKKIVLTDRSRKLEKQWREDSEKTERQITKGFSPEELETLCGFFDRIEKNLETNTADS